MPTNDGGAITRETVFDKFSIHVQPGDLGGFAGYIYSGGDRVGRISTVRIADHRVFDETNPEVIEVQRRLDAGEAELHFEANQHLPPYTTHAWADLQATLWYLPTIYPFHERGVDPHHFFDALARGADYQAATERFPARFIHPGIMEGANRVYYKRDDSGATPDVRAESELTDQGWVLIPPYGAQRLQSITVIESPAGITIEAARRVYFRRPDRDAAIRAIARAYEAWWHGLTRTEQGIIERRTADDHFRMSIGRAWADKPFDDEIRVQRGRSTHDRDARDAEEWYLGNLEEWAFQWGFDAFVLALHQGPRRSLLRTQLDDHTLCHLDENADITDRLINDAEGFTEAEWEAFSTTHFNAALGTVVRIQTGPDRTYSEQAARIVLLSNLDVTNAVGTTTYLWEQLSGPSVTLNEPTSANCTLTGPTLEAGDDPAVLEFRVTATNNGDSASDSVTITINPPASD